MLVTLSTGALLSTATTVGISPFLLDIAREFATDLGGASSLVAIQNVTWGIASLFAGASSDRLGRRPLLLGGLIVLAVCGFGAANADSYGLFALWRAVGGLGGGTFMGTVFATVSDYFPAAERGRSLGWIVTGQSLALVLGVPTMTLVGSVAGWRGAVLAHATVVAMCACSVLLVVPADARQARPAHVPLGSTVRLIGPRVVALLLASSTERVCYAAVAVFLPSYLLTHYPITAPQLALGLGLVASGNLLGNLAGAQISDRVRSPRIVAALSLIGAGALAVPVLSWSPAVPISIALGFAYAVLNSTGRPILLSLVSLVSNEARGAVLGLNITFSSFGWLGATTLGGFVIGLNGFGALGFVTLGFGVLGAVLVLASSVPDPSARLTAVGSTDT